MQPGFDWSADVNAPIAGRTAAARHASGTGAQRATRTRGQVASAYRDLLMRHGPLSDYEAAQLLGRFVSSVNSTRNAWGGSVVPSGQFEATSFRTKRVRWQWVER